MQVSSVGYAPVLTPSGNHARLVDKSCKPSTSSVVPRVDVEVTSVLNLGSFRGRDSYRFCVGKNSPTVTMEH